MFEDFAVEQIEYEELVDSIRSMPAVTEVYHDPNWKEATVYIDPEEFRAFGGLPEGVWILDTRIENSEEHGERVRVLLDTGDWLEGRGSETDNGGVDSGYSDELMAFTKLQVDLVEDVRFSRLIRNENDELRLAVYLENPATYALDDILNWVGCAYSSVAYASEDGLLAMVEHRKRGTDFSPETIDGLRMQKLKRYLEEEMKAEEPTTLPCGHEVQATTVYLSRPTDSPELEKQGDSVTVGDFEAIQVKLAEEDGYGWQLEQSEWPSEYSHVWLDSRYGFVCEECLLGFFPVKQEEFLWDRETPAPEARTVEYEGGENQFMVFPIPYTPRHMGSVDEE